MSSMFRIITISGKDYQWRVVGNQSGVYVDVRTLTSTTVIRHKVNFGYEVGRFNAKKLLTFLFANHK